MTVNPSDPSQPETEKWVQISGRIAAFAVLATVVIVLLMFVHAVWNDANANKIVGDNFRVIIGLPVAGIFSAVIIVLFRTTEGTIRFKAFGFTFEGASGPIIMWVICFLAIVGSIRLLE